MVEQARGLGYVHFERVGARAFAFAPAAALAFGTCTCSLGTSARVDGGRRVRPGVRAMSLFERCFAVTLPFRLLYCTILL